jgi:hypothetical protein
MAISVPIVRETHRHLVCFERQIESAVPFMERTTNRCDISNGTAVFPLALDLKRPHASAELRAVSTCVLAADWHGMCRSNRLAD